MQTKDLQSQNYQAVEAHLKEIKEKERIQTLSEQFRNIKVKAILKHEEERKKAKKRGSNDFPLLPYECSYAFEMKFRRDNGIPFKAKIY